MEKNNNLKTEQYGLIACTALAIIAILPFLVSFGTNENGVYTVAYNRDFFHLEMEKCAVIFFGLIAVIRALSGFLTQDGRKRTASALLAAFFSCCLVFGKSYSDTASWDYVFGSFPAFAGSVGVGIGYWILFYYGIGALFFFIDNCGKPVKENKLLKKIDIRLEAFFEKKPLLKLWLILLICWAPYIIINYPAIVHADSGVMLSQFESGKLFNHHPVVQTVVWGGFVKGVADITGSYNAGVFLFAFIQYAYGSFIMALLFDFVIRKGCPKTIALIALLVAALSPAYARNITSVCKDSNYSLYVMLMVWLLFKTIDLKDRLINENRNLYLLPLWVFTILIVCFAKKSGIHLVLLTLVPLIAYLRKFRRLCAALAAAFLLGIGGYFAGEHIIENVYDIGNDDVQETYSIPFQQTARYVRDFGDEVTEKEREAINAVLDYEALAQRYRPELSDPVKGTYKADSSKKDFHRYLGVWLEMLFKHPGTYIQATMNNIYGYFYPENLGYYTDVYYMSMCVDENKIYAPAALKKASELLRDMNMRSRNLPVIALFSSMGFYVWLDIFAAVYFLFFKRDKRFFIYNLPALITILICIASPANNTMRYGLVTIFSAPLMMCMCFKKEAEQ